MEETSAYCIMIRACDTCGKQFDEFLEGIRYSRAVEGVSFFCSDDCCKVYLDKPGKK
jgi:hypothetical protein